MADETPAKILKFELKQNGDAAKVTCHGRLVAGTTAELYEAVKAVLPGCKSLTVDMEDLSYVDSSGLGVLVRMYLSARSAGCGFKLLQVGKQVSNLLMLTNLMGVLATAEGHSIPVA